VALRPGRKRMISLYIDEGTLARIDALKPVVAGILGLGRPPSRADVIGYAVDRVFGAEAAPVVRLRRG
jgi:hypothetical protein